MQSISSLLKSLERLQQMSLFPMHATTALQPRLAKA